MYIYIYTYITLHYITLRYATLRYVTLHYITLHTYIHTHTNLFILVSDEQVQRLCKGIWFALKATGFTWLRSIPKSHVQPWHGSPGYQAGARSVSVPSHLQTGCWTCRIQVQVGQLLSPKLIVRSCWHWNYLGFGAEKAALFQVWAALRLSQFGRLGSQTSLQTSGPEDGKLRPPGPGIPDQIASYYQ